MHARSTTRGIAAVLLSAALALGGTLATGPAAFAETGAGAAQEQGAPGDPATATADTGSTDASGTGTDQSADGSGDPGAQDPAAQDPAAQDPEAQDPAAEQPTPEQPTTEPGSETTAASVAEPTERVAAATATAKIASISPKQSLTVSVEVRGLPADITAVSGALIVTDPESRLTDPSSDAPAFADPSSTVVNGESSFELTAPVDTLDRGQQYEVLIWKQHSPATAENIYARADVAISAADWDRLTGTEVADMEVGSLDWGVLSRFRDYVEGPIAHGKVTVQQPATAAGKNFRFPQVTGGSWKSGAATGSVAYGGSVAFTGHDGALDLTLSNPTINLTSAKRAVLSVSYASTDMATGKWTRGTAAIATVDLSRAKRVAKPGGAVQWQGATTALTQEGVAVFQDFYETGQVLDPITFTAGSASDAKPVDPSKPPTTKPGTTKPKPRPTPVAPAAGGSAKAAGSLTWGVSSAFADYVTGPIAKGEVSTSGVGTSGGAYLFPQAAGGSWNAKTRTGSVQYSGVITFTGHKGLLSETFSNPVITVTSESSGTISAGGRSFGLDLGSASRSVGAHGEVSWSGVPVSGSITGGAGGGSSHSLPVDSLSFTVGSASGVSYGSTSVSNASKKRVAAEAPPTTTGITVLTEAEKIVPGAEIEFEAAGFDAKEREILVVLYSGGGPVTLDDAAGADASGTVRWIGTLPDDVALGEHTLTLQGSGDAGAVIEVVKPKQKSKLKSQVSGTAPLEADSDAAIVAGVIAPTGGMALWEWWASAGGLAVIAACMTALVIRQRRTAP